MLPVSVRSVSVSSVNKIIVSVTSVSEIKQEHCVCVQAREKEVIQEKEQMNLQIAEMSILARIKQDEGMGGQGQEEGGRGREREVLV